MVIPLVIGAVRVAGAGAARIAARTANLGTKTASTGAKAVRTEAGAVARSRVARSATLTAEKAGDTRFTQTQSLAARVARQANPSTPITLEQRVMSNARSRITNTAENGQTDDTQEPSQTQRVLGLAMNTRLFMPLLSPLIFVSVLIAVMGILGVIALIGAGAISWFSLGLVDMKGLGMLFIGLSFVCVILAYPAVLIYLVVMKGIKPFTLTGLPFVAFFMLPVFDMVPGLNIFPWLILWAFILCTASQK